MNAILEVHNLGLAYTLRHEKYTTLKERLVHLFQPTEERQILWAVRGLTFSLPRGSSLGIIGRNGSGKSSLLKVLSGVLQPDEGGVRCQGRISALLELGTGFHPELTGVENILLFGSLLGVPRAEMRKRIPRIAAFAELEDFIDVPVKNYSTGMYMRLGFAVAIDVEPDILLVDEVLAVGDYAFQAKCYERIEQLRREGVSIVLVSHDLGLVERFCEYALWLENGVPRIYAESPKAVAYYLNQATPEYVAVDRADYSEVVLRGAAELLSLRDPGGSGAVEIDRVSLCLPSVHSVERLPVGSPFTLRFHYRRMQDLLYPTWRVRLEGGQSRHVFDSFAGAYSIANLPPEGVVDFSLPGGAIPADQYRVSVEVASAHEGTLWCKLAEVVPLSLLPDGSQPAPQPAALGMFRASHDPFAMSRCCRFHYREAGLEHDFATLGEGWHEVEYHGVGMRWSAQKCSFGVHNPEERGQLCLTVQVGYLLPGDPPLTGEVRQAERLLGRFSIGDVDFHELTFSLADRKDPYPRLSLAVSRVMEPGRNPADLRSLGLAVMKIRLV